MLKRRKLTIGRSYVNEDEGVVREVTDQPDRWSVEYAVYDLRSGRLRGPIHEIVKKNLFLDWADREASREEAARLQRDELQALFRVHQKACSLIDNRNTPINEPMSLVRANMASR